MVDGYPIGVVEMIDNDRVDEKIIAIPYRDPTYNSFHDLSDLPLHTVSEVSHFFDVYKALEHSKTSVTQTKGREEAVRIVAQAIQRYREVFADGRQATPAWPADT